MKESVQADVDRRIAASTFSIPGYGLWFDSG
jgi:hypothetical protein